MRLPEKAMKEGNLRVYPLGEKQSRPTLTLERSLISPVMGRGSEASHRIVRSNH